jgi:uncharacterized membrane protein YhaH (DUF805 family)
MRYFNRFWFVLLLVSVVLTFGAGGGTPNTTPWHVIKFGVLAILLISLLAAVATELRRGTNDHRHS